MSLPESFVFAEVQSGNYYPVPKVKERHKFVSHLLPPDDVGATVPVDKKQPLSRAVIVVPERKWHREMYTLKPVRQNCPMGHDLDDFLDALDPAAAIDPNTGAVKSKIADNALARDPLASYDAPDNPYHPYAAAIRGRARVSQGRAAWTASCAGCRRIPRVRFRCRPERNH